MKTSTVGIDLIKSFEGYRNKAYQDSVGVWTIGWGTTKVNGVAVKSGMTCTETQATEWMKADLIKFENNVNKFSAYDWNQNEFDALVSFAYNIGSIDQLTANGTRDKITIANKILEYNKAGGVVLSGLVRRRKEEQALFLKSVMDTPIEQPEEIDWTIGNTYTIQTQSGLKIRAGADINAGPATMITNSAKSQAKLSNGFYVLPKGTRVTCKAIIEQDKYTWMQIPSGYICCKEGEDVYVW